MEPNEEQKNEEPLNIREGTQKFLKTLLSS